jgi:hypothetical protein
MGTTYGIYPCDSALLMGKIDGETFLGRLLIFFFGGTGEGKRNSRSRNAETMRRCFAGRCEFRTALCVCIYYMLGCGSFVATCLQDITKGVLDPRLSWVDTFAVRLRQPVDIVPHFYTHAVYVIGRAVDLPSFYLRVL